MIGNSTWCSKLAYLIDVLNALNLSMQGIESNILSVPDKLCTFPNKLRMWSQEIESTDSVAMFSRDIQLQHYFPSLTRSDKDWIRNPFHIQAYMSGLQLRENEQPIDDAAESDCDLISLK
ncbi:hypothetical protein HZS_2511 [Henneguya salminicola]|nr:hypothetical protein HZS_2511 [Henneguya salminicola]